MISRKLRKILKVILLVIIGVTVFGFVVKGLWNWLIPPIFAWHTITFWQAVGLLILCKILFGGFRGGHGGGRHWRHRMGERWAQMSEEEREQFRQSMKGKFERVCG